MDLSRTWFDIDINNLALKLGGHEDETYFDLGNRITYETY